MCARRRCNRREDSGKYAFRESITGVLWGSGRRSIRRLRLSFFLETFLKPLGGVVLQLLEHGKGLLGILDAVQSTINDTQLIPSLLNYFRLRARFRYRLVKRIRGSSIVAELHLRPPQIVGGIFQRRIFAQGAFYQFFAFRTLAALGFQRTKLIPRQHVVWIDFEFAAQFRFGFVG